MTIYAYDGDNRLVRVSRGTSTLATFTYDPFGRRVSKTTAAGIAYYVYDGEYILAEVDAAGTLLTYYVHGPGIDEPLAMIRGGQTYYYHADALGTITQLTNSSGAVVQSYEYDSFGNIVSHSGTIVQPYTYTAREWDAETGLYYYRARYYDPQVGRFISEDLLQRILPFIIQAQNMSRFPKMWVFSRFIAKPETFHAYTYVWNNAINQKDPLGLDAEDRIGKILITSMSTFWRIFGCGTLNIDNWVIVRAIPGLGATIFFLADPTPLSDPYLGPDGKWYYPDGTPVPQKQECCRK